VVQGTDTELRLGNAVLLLTRLPVSEEELNAFIAGPSAAKSGKKEPAVPNLLVFSNWWILRITSTVPIKIPTGPKICFVSNTGGWCLHKINFCCPVNLWIRTRIIFKC
jgi:hypothetical protein